jgi:putative endonuclease
MKGYLYIIQSFKNGIYYIGSTIDLKNRIKKHNNGKVIATKNKGPWILKFYCEYTTIREARQIEYKLKKFKNRNIVERIIREKEIKIKI